MGIIWRCGTRLHYQCAKLSIVSLWFQVLLRRKGSYDFKEDTERLSNKCVRVMSNYWQYDPENNRCEQSYRFMGRGVVDLPMVEVVTFLENHEQRHEWDKYLLVIIYTIDHDWLLDNSYQNLEDLDLVLSWISHFSLIIVCYGFIYRTFKNWNGYQKQMSLVSSINLSFKVW